MNTGKKGPDSVMKDNYEFYRRTNAQEEKARLVNTTQGQVPLRRGQYGMDVEEYLEWCTERASQYRVKAPNEE